MTYFGLGFLLALLENCVPGVFSLRPCALTRAAVRHLVLKIGEVGALAASLSLFAVQ